MMGSEAGFAITPYGHWHARELALFVRDLDMSPMDAILSCTKYNQLAVRHGHDVGVLETGTLADLLVVDGDPLKDIRILQDRSRFSVIMQGGELIDLTRPWPERQVYAFEKVMTLGESMTQDKVGWKPPAR